jgi:hypothetical protein
MLQQSDLKSEKVIKMNEVTGMKDIGIEELKQKAIEMRKTALTMLNQGIQEAPYLQPMW